MGAASKDSLMRGIELAMTKGSDVSLLALRYIHALQSRAGGCIEVMLTALCWYAEVEEGCPKSTDDAYCVHADDITTRVIAEAQMSTWKPEWWGMEVARCSDEEAGDAVYSASRSS